MGFRRRECRTFLASFHRLGLDRICRGTFEIFVGEKKIRVGRRKLGLRRVRVSVGEKKIRGVKN